VATVTVCSTSFTGLGQAQARALGFPDLPIAVVEHPFGLRSRDEIRAMAGQCVSDIARLVREPGAGHAHARGARPASAERARVVEAPADFGELNRYFLERKWGDGLPIVPPTQELVEHMLKHAGRAPGEVVALIAPAFREATVERIAINAVMAGCHPEYLPVLIAAAEAVATREFHLQSIQATTNPAAVWLLINGPVAQRLNVNSGNNCLGQGTWANATLGRALRLMLQNIGGALPGEMDRATQGQPGKFTFCCAENEAANPWQPLHVERGFAAEASTVTVVAPLGTWNMNVHAKDAADLLRVIADTMTFPTGSDYVCGGRPCLMLAPEHAHILHREGLSKADVKQRLWELSMLAAHRLSAKDFERTRQSRREELGDIMRESMLPISVRPDDITVIVAGGAGTHSVYFPVSGRSCPVTREVMLPD
jgi:hypothetical protein